MYEKLIFVWCRLFLKVYFKIKNEKELNRRPRQTIHLLAAVGYSIIHLWVFMILHIMLMCVCDIGYAFFWSHTENRLLI